MTESFNESLKSKKKKKLKNRQPTTKCCLSAWYSTTNWTKQQIPYKSQIYRTSAELQPDTVTNNTTVEWLDRRTDKSTISKTGTFAWSWAKINIKKNHIANVMLPKTQSSHLLAAVQVFFYSFLKNFNLYSDITTKINFNGTHFLIFLLFWLRKPPISKYQSKFFFVIFFSNLKH